jgi:ligand-binding sensor domain-containing protein/signal transduction histidine kinase
VEQGLSNFSISDIVQDQQGFLWIATEEGLNKYDGYDFTVYKADPADSNALPNSFIGQLYLDRAGSLWINAGHLFRYDPHSDSFDRFERFFENTKNPPGQFITRVIEDRSGEFWIGTSEGLYRYNRQREVLSHYRHDPNDSTSISVDHITAFGEDHTGALWIGTLNGGVNRFDRERNIFKRYRHDPANPNGLSSDFIWCILENRRGVVWIGTENGLCRYDRRTDQVHRYRSDSDASNTIGSDRLSVLFEDSQGTLWAGTRNLGLWRYEPQTDGFLQYQHDPNDPYALSGNRIHAIHEDRSGVLWIGHYRAGLSRHAHRQDKFARNKINAGVYAIWQDRNANLWVGGTGTGLMQFDREGELVAHYRHDPQNSQSLSSDVIWAIREDRQGRLWIGTDRGLNLYDTKRRQFIRYRHKPLDPNNAEHLEVKIIYEDSKGEIWIGTKGSGLLRWDEKRKTFIYYQPDPKNPQSLSGASVWAICEDQRGDLWIGTFGAGLNRFDRETQRFTRYVYDPKQRDNSSHPTIYSLHLDSSGGVWIGTFGGGLQRFNPRTNRFTYYTDRNGLIDNFVKGLMPDAEGNLWLSTDKGLSRFDPRTETFKNFTVKDGLINNVLLSGAYCRGHDGRLFFGGEGGVIAFHPDSLKENSNPPPVVITDFKVFDKSLPRRPQPKSPPTSGDALPFIRLSYRANFFSFEFVALDFTEPGKNQYAYKLEGFDQEWIYCGTRRYASYTNVDPGAYVFRVKGANSDGVWNEKGASIKITIIPPFWQTWWFRLLAFATMSLLAWSAYRYRVNRLLEMERLRTRLSADLHDEIAGNLSSIAMFGKIMQDEAAAGGEKLAGPELLKRIIMLAQDSVTSIREIIWAIDPKPETIHNLLMRAHDFAVAACRAQSMALKFDAPKQEQLPAKNLAPEQRKHLWLLLKEAITNAVKHSGGTELAIYASFKAGHLNISIIDNGSGLNGASSSARFSGKGLGTMKARAEQLKGAFGMFSDESGTTVNVTIKI